MCIVLVTNITNYF